jgi:hypothetical protein
MNKAYQEWRNGRSEWDVFDDSGNLIATVANESELPTVATVGGESFVRCECHRADEPRFLVRDGSGRGWCAETLYTSFTVEEREYREDEDDEFGQTFGEWMDSSSAGDEFDNSDSMFTVIRIN